MKRLLIISPHFPPVNAADMHRVRHSLPYFRKYGWDPEVITVDPAYIESYSTDPLLIKTIPDDIPVHLVGAWDVNKTRKFGLGSLSMRSWFHFRKKGNELLRKKKFDLVYFSTTAFHVMALGPYWQRKFGIPFVVDIQDPWRKDFYLDKPASQRPKKFWVAYTIDKILEARTIPQADGMISVSPSYCSMFESRYGKLRYERCEVIPFGGSDLDFEVIKKFPPQSTEIKLEHGKVNLVYIGRGGYDMNFAVRVFFLAVKKGLAENPEMFSDIHAWFIGTSYAKRGQGKKTIEPVADELGLQGRITEVTDRIPYFESLQLMQQADILFVPGSVDSAYTASKIYPYILAEKPLLAIFHEQSSVVSILNETRSGQVITFEGDNDPEGEIVDRTFQSLNSLLKKRMEKFTYDREAFKNYSAETMTRKQAEYFDSVLKTRN